MWLAEIYSMENWNKGNLASKPCIFSVESFFFFFIQPLLKKHREEFWQIGFVANLKYVLTKMKSWWNCHYLLNRHFDFIKVFEEFVNGLSTNRDTISIGYMMCISIEQSTTKNANGQSCHLAINWDGHSLSTNINIEYW